MKNGDVPTFHRVKQLMALYRHVFRVKLQWIVFRLQELVWIGTIGIGTPPGFLLYRSHVKVSLIDLPVPEWYSAMTKKPCHA